MARADHILPSLPDSASTSPSANLRSASQVLFRRRKLRLRRRTLHRRQEGCIAPRKLATAQGTLRRSVERCNAARKVTLRQGSLHWAVERYNGPGNVASVHRTLQRRGERCNGPGKVTLRQGTLHRAMEPSVTAEKLTSPRGRPNGSDVRHTTGRDSRGCRSCSVPQPHRPSGSGRRIVPARRMRDSAGLGCAWSTFS